MKAAGEAMPAAMSMDMYGILSIAIVRVYTHYDILTVASHTWYALHILGMPYMHMRNMHMHMHMCMSHASHTSIGIQA